MARHLLIAHSLSMKSNRMRSYRPITAKERFRPESFQESLSLPIKIEDLPAPLPIAKISPDQLIEDILISTLRRVQEHSAPEVAAAAARYISLLSEKAV